MNIEKDKEISALMTLAQDGDCKAYEDFLLQIADVLKSYLGKRISEIEIVDDVLQESLLSIHNARHTYTGAGPIGPWIYAIANHRMIDFYRRMRRIQRIEIPSDEDFMEGIQHSDHKPNTKSSIVDLLNELPEKQRRIIQLLKIDDLSVKEVSSKLGISESLVKVTAFRGYEALRRLLGVSKNEN